MLFFNTTKLILVNSFSILKRALPLMLSKKGTPKLLLQNKNELLEKKGKTDEIIVQIHFKNIIIAKINKRFMYIPKNDMTLGFKINSKSYTENFIVKGYGFFARPFLKVTLRLLKTTIKKPKIERNRLVERLKVKNASDTLVSAKPYLNDKIFTENLINNRMINKVNMAYKEGLSFKIKELSLNIELEEIEYQLNNT